MDKEFSTTTDLSGPLPPLNKSAAGVELLEFCIHLFYLFSIQTSSVFQST